MNTPVENPKKPKERADGGRFAVPGGSSPDRMSQNLARTLAKKTPPKGAGKIAGSC